MVISKWSNFRRILRNISHTPWSALSQLWMYRISFGYVGRFTAAEILSFFVSFTLVCLWVLTGHWLLMDGKILFWLVLLRRSLFLRHVAMGMGLCVAFIALVRLPSLKVSTMLLSGLLIYDVFWVRNFFNLLHFRNNRWNTKIFAGFLFILPF